MQNHIRLYQVNGNFYHGVVLYGGRLVLIGYLGRVGDCIRP